MLAIAGCTFDEVTVPATVPQVAIHAVLNPSAPSQVVLVERTLNGTLTVTDSTFDPNNPILSSGGAPISGSAVDLIDSTGRATRGVETKTSGGVGTGVYVVSPAQGVRPGSRYTLRVVTPDGKEITGTTRIPRPDATSSGALTRIFNRDHDTLLVAWNRAPDARTYAVRVESPYGPFFLFTDSTKLRFTGATRNLFSDNLQHLFIPGFRQDMLVAAVDSNFYDYYRTNNDPFTGSGIINRLSGGIGLFGSLVTMTNGTLTVTADQTESIEGRWRVQPTPADGNAPSSFTLYVESKSTRADVPDAISGRYTLTPAGGLAGGIVGEMTGTHVNLVLVANQLAHDTLDVFTGDLAASGGQLVGTFRKRAGTFTLIKQ